MTEKEVTETSEAQIAVHWEEESYYTPRIGIIYSQDFVGFSGSACADRIVDSVSNILITMDSYYRGGKLLYHKEKADEAVTIAAKQGQVVEKVLVWQRYPGKYSARTPMVEGRDFFVNDILKDYYGARVEPVKMPAEAPLFLIYTSGTTGKRRVLASISNNRDVGDTMTLANPEIVDEIKKMVQG
jgi:acyl-coenzyme A synthetase/AMP-(fatty) acid ligase